jgi:hypothetical protein
MAQMKQEEQLEEPTESQREEKPDNIRYYRPEAMGFTQAEEQKQ